MIYLFALSHVFLLEDYLVLKIGLLNACLFSLGGAVYPCMHEVNRKFEKAERRETLKRERERAVS